MLFTGLADILSGLTAEGKDRLNTLLEKAEPEYNIRFLVCDTVKGITALTACGWYKRFVTGNDGCGPATESATSTP